MTRRNLADFFHLSRKIVGVARNYRNPAQSHDMIPHKPFMFLKPPSAFIKEGEAIKIPRPTSIITHEVELGLIIGETGKNIPESQAVNHIGGYILALDMTDKTELKQAQDACLPWLFVKGFDTSCPVSDFIPKERIPDPDDVDLWLKVNGELRQKDNTKNMVYNAPKLVSWISRRFRLDPGDVILTGTPEGMDPVKAGDTIECGLNGIVEMTYLVEDA